MVDDSVFGYDTRSYINAAGSISQEGAVTQPLCSVHLAVVVDDAVDNLLGVGYLHIVAYQSAFGQSAANICSDELEKCLTELLVMRMLEHECCQLTAQFGERDDVPIASLVEYTDDIGFSIGSSLCSLYCGYVGQVALVTDGIVIDESSYVLDEAIVSDDDIVQGGIADARVLVKARTYLDALVEAAYADFSVEHYLTHVFGIEVFCDVDGSPVLSPTAILLQLFYLFGGKRSVIVHSRCFLFVVLIQEIIIGILLYVQLAHFLVQNVAELVDVLLVLGRDEETVVVQLRHPCALEFVEGDVFFLYRSKVVFLLLYPGVVVYLVEDDH